MAILYFLIDSLTHEPYRGNPTPVCIASPSLNSETMHRLAIELNAPVTAFITQQPGNNIYKISYYTITGEISACGHATIASAFIIFMGQQEKEICFLTNEQVMLVARKQDDLTFVKYPIYNFQKFDIPPNLKSSLGLDKYLNDFYCSELETLFFHLEHEDQVRDMRPDFRGLIESSSMVKEVVVMSQSSTADCDFVIRSFCPWIGINEDPVTGSVHSVLGPYWNRLLRKDEMIAYQASKRGGYIHVKVHQDAVEIGGHNKLIIKGELLI